jgi:hypothetical protein
MPWWIADVGQGHAVHIYGWGLRQNLEQLSIFVENDLTPIYQTALAWIYLTVSSVLALASAWIKGGKGQWLLGSIGFIYILYGTVAVFVVVNNRISELNSGGSQIAIPLQGTVQIAGFGANVITIHTTLHFGYYLACTVGLILIVLAMLRGWFIEKPKIVECIY